MHTTSSPIRRGPRLPAVILAAAVLGLGGAPATGLAKNPKPATTTTCEAGAIKTVTVGKGKQAVVHTYVCDTHGKWIEVVDRLDVLEGSLASLALVAAVQAPTDPPPPAPQKPKPGTTHSGCQITGDVWAAVGDEMTVTTYVTNEKGDVVSITHTKYKCGANGEWTVVPKAAVAVRLPNNKNPELVR